MNKKILLLVLFVSLCFAVSGCGKNKEEEKTVVGGWNYKVDNAPQEVPVEAKEAYAKVAEKEGLNYEVVSLIATQLVSGDNFMYLCKDAVNNKWVIVTIYNDLDNNTSLLGTYEFDVTSIEQKEDDEDVFVGGWVIYEYIEDVLASEYSEIFNAALKDEEDTYKPVAILGTQVVAGTNYAFLALKETADGRVDLCVISIYNDLENNSSVNFINKINIADYNK